MTKQPKHEDLKALLNQGLDALELTLSEQQQQQLLTYIQLMHKWNQVYNLTAVRQLETMVVKHLLDSLSILPFIQPSRLLDVGTGPGLPGIPLAIACPQNHVHLLDTNGKKVRFLTQVVAELGLEQVKPIHSRVESYQPAQQYDTILLRAFGSLALIWHNSAHLLQPTGQVIAMKGQYPKEEIVALPPDVNVTVQAVTVPMLNSERHIICLKKR